MRKFWIITLGALLLGIAAREVMTPGEPSAAQLAAEAIAKVFGRR